MELKNKIIAGLVGLGIASATAVVALDQQCVFDAVKLNIRNDKVCFDTEQNYEAYKRMILSKYKANGSNLWMWVENEREEFFAVANREMPKRKFKSFGLNSIVQELKK